MRIPLLLGAAMTLIATAAIATPIIGSFPAGISVTPPGTLLGVGSTLTLMNGATTGMGTGDFGGTLFGSPVINGVTPSLTLANGQAFDFTLAGIGTFMGTSSNVKLNPLSNSNNRAVAFDALGTFTPFGPTTVDTASLTGAFTQTGGATGAVSFSFTLNAPAVRFAVPEPAAVGVLGLGIAGLALARRRRAA